MWNCYELFIKIKFFLSRSISNNDLANCLDFWSHELLFKYNIGWRGGQDIGKYLIRNMCQWVRVGCNYYKWMERWVKLNRTYHCSMWKIYLKIHQTVSLEVKLSSSLLGKYSIVSHVFQTEYCLPKGHY